MKFDPAATVVLRNPIAGRRLGLRRRATQVTAALKARGYRVLVTDGPGRTTSLAAQAVRDGAKALIVVGGDGTVNEAIRELDHDVALAVYPAGTINLLARALTLPQNPDVWLELLAAGTTRNVYTARGNGVPFCAVGSVGLDGKTVHDLNPKFKKYAAEGAFVWAALKGYFAYRTPYFDVRLDDEAWTQGPLQGIIFGLGPCYGGAKTIFPAARPEDPRLSVALLVGQHKRVLWKYVYGMLTGSLPRMRGPVYCNVKSLYIRADPPTEVQLDGEPFGFTPLKIEVDSRPRTMLAPAPGTHGQKG